MPLSFFALGHDGDVQALADFSGEFVDFVAAINLNGLAGGVEDDFAVAALSQVDFNLGAGVGGDDSSRTSSRMERNSVQVMLQPRLHWARLTSRRSELRKLQESCV